MMFDFSRFGSPEVFGEVVCELRPFLTGLDL